jgi:DNA-binding NarL/FixJ family response regulator
MLAVKGTMTFRVAIVANTHLVRQPVAACLLPIGARVHEFAELTHLLTDINAIDPEIVLIDVDGLQQGWRAFAAAMRGSPRPALVVLLGTRFDFEDAHEALALGVASIILKPYRREDHTERLYDLVLKLQRVRPRRREPRLVPSESLSPRLDYEEQQGRGIAGVRDLSSEGICVDLPDGDGLRPGSFVGQATLAVRERTSSFTAHVIHRASGRAGLRVRTWHEGRQHWMRLLEDLHTRAFGTRRANRRW